MSLWIAWLTACSESHLTAKEAEAGLRELRVEPLAVDLFQLVAPAEVVLTPGEDVPFGDSLDVPPCSGTQVLPELEARWVDAAGRAVVSTANPLVITCGGR